MLRKHSKKITAALALFLAALMLLSVIVTIVGTAGAVSQAELDALKKKASSLKNEKSAITSELNQLQKEKNNAISQKKALDQQISVIESQIENATQLIAAFDEQIAVKESEIAAAEAEEAAEYALFKQRVRAMEENRSASYWGVLLKAESFSDLLSRTSVINDIIEYDKQLMAKLGKIREEIVTAKTELEQDRTEHAAIKAELEGQKLEAEQRYEEQANFITELEADEAEYKAALEAAQKAEREAEAEVNKMIKELAKLSVYVGGEWGWPLPGYYTVTSEFNPNRYHPVLKKYTAHTGTDIAAPKGTTIVASNSGNVIIAGWNNGYGNYVVIDHGGGYTTLYGHMSQILTKKGADVKKGEKIGLVGSTGYSTGPHLHFGISKNGTYINPMQFFKKS
ncbi:MAG: peptidoglycan DD-metalloendopeptidase family protein [Oscillospiraceae bacterium]|jgi:murein DD-endopeptidase MepM/ murein hydrolase activator NlpD|nr:peptidoglycan DD-metalloendopeptidase family protein [Oscillospiraceae bacterium]